MSASRFTFSGRAFNNWCGMSFSSNSFERSSDLLVNKNILVSNSVIHQEVKELLEKKEIE